VRPQLSLRLACPSIGLTLLHGSLYDGLPAIGRPAVVASRPWAATAAGGSGAASTVLLDISLPRGIEARHIEHRAASRCLDVDVPALIVATITAASEQLRLLDLSGLRFSMRAFLTNCHWAPVPGLDSVLMGVAESSRDVTVSIQRLDLGA
jgi:hypothetical protein